MKILVIAQPRSRSMWLVSLLAAFFNLKNLKEPYGLQYDFAWNQNNFDQWFKSVLSINSNLSLKDDFVAKLQTNNLYWGDSWQGPRLFNVNRYDKVYVLRRDCITDAVCSMDLAIQLKRWHHLEIPNEIEPRQFNMADNEGLLLDTIRAHEALIRIKSYLETENINYTDLSFENLKGWVEKNLPNVSSHLVESNFDYTKIYTNYKDIESYFQNTDRNWIFKNV